MGGTWWHYTTVLKLREIIASRQLKRTGVQVQGRERRAVWVSCRTEWEPTATKAITTQAGLRKATLAEMVMFHGGLVRLEVADALVRHTWSSHRRIGQIDPRVADGLERAAIIDGADPGQWRLSYYDIPTEKLSAIEASTDGTSWWSAGQFVDGSARLELSFLALVGAWNAQLLSQQKE
jgi:hypothetical protein